MKKARVLRAAANAKAWALGKQQRNGFQVRRIVWGRLMARFEKREGEQIRAAVISVAPQPACAAPLKRARKNYHGYWPR